MCLLPKLYVAAIYGDVQPDRPETRPETLPEDAPDEDREPILVLSSLE